MVCVLCVNVINGLWRDLCSFVKFFREFHCTFSILIAYDSISDPESLSACQSIWDGFRKAS